MKKLLISVATLALTFAMLSPAQAMTAGGDAEAHRPKENPDLIKTPKDKPQPKKPDTTKK